MDYSVLNKTPDVAQAVVGHFVDINGNAVPQGASAPSPVAGPLTSRATQAPTVSSGAAYAAGNVVGGLLTFAGMARTAGQGGVLQSALLRDKSGQNTNYDLFLFDAAPAAPSDRTAIVQLAAADLAKCVGVVSFSGQALGAASTMGVQTVGGLGLAFKLTSGTTLFGILVTRGTPTYAGERPMCQSISSCCPTDERLSVPGGRVQLSRFPRPRRPE